MRKKQLLAWMLAGALSIGMAPVTALAAEDVVTAAETETQAEAGAGEDFNAGGDAAEAPSEEPVETPPAEESVTTPPAEETTPSPEGEAAPETGENTEETPVPETTVTEAPSTAPTEESTATPSPEASQTPEASQAPTETPTAAPTPEVGTGTKEDPFTNADALKNALEQAQAGETAAEIYVKSDTELEFNAPVAITGNVKLIAVGTAILSRAEGMVDKLFSISNGAKLELAVSEGASLTLDGAQTADKTATAALVDVAEGGAFAMGEGVSLSGNVNPTGAAAIDAKGTVALNGGSISGNTGAKGAVYVSGSGELKISGNVSIKDNLSAADGKTKMNVLLAEGRTVEVAGELAQNASVGLTSEKAAKGLAVVTISKEAASTDWASKVVYDSEAFKIGAEGKLEETGGTDPEEPTATPTPEAKIGYVENSIQWKSYESVTATLKTNISGTCYYMFKLEGEKVPTVAELKASGTDTKPDEEMKILINKSGLTDAKDYILYAYVENDEQHTNIAAVNLVDSANSKYKRPAKDETPDPEPEHTPVIPPVTDSFVQGLEEPLEFYPGVTYGFKVFGAGYDNENPGEGDVRWAPRYWSTSSQPDKSQQHTSWQIGHPSGISQAATYNMYIFFEKCVYKDGRWVATGEIERVTFQFQSAEITITGTPGTGNDGNMGDLGNGGGDLSGSGNKAVTGEVTGATKTSKNATTADEAPVGSMFLLLAASLLAGGYVLTRKRVK